MIGLIAGCPDDAPPEPSTELAAAVNPTWVAPACTSAALGPPVVPGASGPTCNGPWRYDYEDQSCTAPSCAAFFEKRSWHTNVAGDFGATRVVNEGWKLWPATGNHYSNTCTYRCVGSRCTPLGCTGTLSQDTCPQVAQGRRAALLANAIEPLGPAMPIPAGAPGLASFTVAGRGTGFATETIYEDGLKYVITSYSCETLATSLPQPTLGRFPINGCETVIDPVCTLETGRSETSPLAERPVNAGTPAAGWTRRFIDVAPFQSPWCSTCDEVADPAARLACYETNLAAATGALRTSLIARMKLLYQLSGDRLVAARPRIMELYETEAAAPACTSVQSFGPACEGDTAASEMRPAAQLCHDLAANASASSALIGLELDACIQLLADTANLAAPACRAAAREAIDLDLRALFDRTYPAFTGDLATQLPPVFRRLSTWRAAAGAAAGTDTGWLAAASARMLGSLWTKLHAARRLLPDFIDTSDPVAAKLAAASLVLDVEEDDLATDLAVIDALFTSDMPISPFILSLTGDALVGLADRLEVLQRFHDVGCAFANCKPGTVARASALTQALAVLAALPDATRFSQAVDGATLVYNQNPALWLALDRIRDHHGYLAAAWTATGRGAAELARLHELADPPPEAVKLAASVRRAYQAQASYQADGRFSPAYAPRPSTAPVQPLQLAAQLGALRLGTADARAAYDAARVDQVNLALQAAHSDGAMQAVLDRGAAIAARKRDLISDLAGLQTRQRMERERLASYQRGFEQIVDGVLTGDYEYDALPLGTLQISAADAHYPSGATVLTRDRVAVRRVNSGELVRFSVSGGWSPSCRLSSAVVLGPTGPTGVTVPVDARNELITGPRGYWASSSTTGFTAETTTSTNTLETNVALKTSACVSAGVSLPLVVNASASVQTCLETSIGHRFTLSASSADGTDRRTGASFDFGIRLSETPFPDAPAGALLAVLTPADAPGVVLDVQVVGNDHTLIAPRLPGGAAGAIDLHLVVNDRIGCALPASPSALTVVMVRSTPIGVAARDLSAATTAGLAAIDAVAAEVLAQGELPASEHSRLRNLAWQEAQRLLNLRSRTISDLPAELRQWFEIHVDAAVASLDRRAQIQALRRENARLDAELDAAAHELLYGNTQRYLTGLLPRLRLRALDSGEYLMRADPLATALAVHVPQTLALRALTWQPARAAEIQTRALALVDRVLTAPPVEAVHDLEALAATVQAALTDTQFDPSPPVPQLVVVAIPYPRTDQLRYDAGYHQVSAATAAEFWRQAQLPGNQRVTVTLSPQDIFGGPLTSARLSCTTQAPMVRRMALFLQHAHTGDLNLLNVNASSTAAAAAPVQFPLVGRMFSLPSVAPGVPAALRVLGDRTATEVETKFTAHVPPGLGAGAGLSPFTSFAIDMAFFRDPSLDNFRVTARALFLVFEIEGRESVSEVSVPGLCGTLPN